MLALWVVATLLLAGLAALVYQGIAIVLAYQMPRLDAPSAPATGAYPRISVVIAARDEEADLGPCLDGFLAQDYPDLEILVVDGASRDRTREVARARAPRVRLLEEPPLPAGWVGKSWACHTGFAASTGTWVLFADADVRPEPTAVRAAYEWGRSQQADLVTLAPRIEMVGFWERVVLPFYTQMVLTYFRAPRVNRDGSSSAMANGQFLLVRREAYLRAGGHEAIRGAVLEDVRLAQEFRRTGSRLRVAWAPELATTRMYRDRRELFEGLLRNMHGTRFSPAREAAFIAGLVGFFWLPLALLPIGWWFGSLPLILFGGFVWVALFAKHVGFVRGTRGRAAYGLLYPVAVGFYVVLLGCSLGQGLRGRPVAWKGRQYGVDSGSPSDEPSANR